MPANLPGYYFDPDKNRYFKIQASHFAPAGSNYSRQAVKAAQLIEGTQQRDDSIQKSKLATTIKRSKILHHPLLSFDRRLGDLRKNIRASVAEYYAASLNQYNTSHNQFKTRETSSSLGYVVPKSGCFAVDRISATLFADVVLRNDPHGATRLFAFDRSEDPFPEEVSADQDAAAWRLTAQQEWSGALYRPRRRSMMRYSMTLVTRVENITSIGNGLVLWVQGGHRPDQAPQESRVRVAACHSGPFSSRSDVVHDAAFYAHIESVAVQPGISTGQPSYQVVLATGNSLWLMDTSTWQYPVAKYPHNDGTNDITTVQFKDHNILIAGTRSGKMLLLDTREPSSTNAARIQHSSAIANIRALPQGTQTSILVAGLGSEGTKTYDLRYTPLPSRKSHAPRANSYRLSQSIMTFSVPETHRQTQYGLGWAYDDELNLMVHASTDYVKNHRVGLWDCSSGKMVPGPLNEFVFEGPVRCADVVRARDGPKSILLGMAGREIVEWTNQGLGSLKGGNIEDG